MTTPFDPTNCAKCNRPMTAQGHRRGPGWTHDPLMASGYVTLQPVGPVDHEAEAAAALEIYGDASTDQYLAVTSHA